jgi:glycosyltransferase involved in cell wall biosynthesis
LDGSVDRSTPPSFRSYLFRLSQKPRVTVIIETITARFESVTGSLAEVEPTLAALAEQTYPAEAMEMILVVDDDASFAAASEVVRRHPGVRIVRSQRANYFEAKNAGARAATGEIVALIDSDCVPSAGWLEALVAKLGDADAVAGASRYTGRTWAARTFSVFDLAHVVAERDGASGFNLSNVAFRRDVLLAHPLDERIRRHGGCYLLFKQLRTAGVRVAYAHDAKIAHGIDIRGPFGFVRKHYERGYDGVAVYRLDDSAALAGTRAFRRLGAAALLPIHARRIALDWRRIALHHREVGVRLVTLPFFALLSVVLRSIELAGGLAACAHRPPAVRESSIAA